jgi:environmental stress-induced protein Ves
MTSEVDPGMAEPAPGMRVARSMQAPGTWAGGTTRAIYAYPPGPGLTPATARFWLGTAVIEQPAPYSYFPNRTRIHIPIHGNGIRLRFQEPAEVVALGTFDQYHFDGARPVQVELVEGPVVAFNLITQSDVLAQAHVTRVAAGATMPAFLSAPPETAVEYLSVVRVVYAVDGAVRVQGVGNEPVELEPGDAFVLLPSRLRDNLGRRAELRCEAADAAVVAATVVF